MSPVDVGTAVTVELTERVREVGDPNRPAVFRAEPALFAEIPVRKSLRTGLRT